VGWAKLIGIALTPHIVQQLPRNRINRRGEGCLDEGLLPKGRVPIWLVSQDRGSGVAFATDKPESIFCRLDPNFVMTVTRTDYSLAIGFHMTIFCVEDMAMAFPRDYWFMFQGPCLTHRVGNEEVIIGW